MQSLEQPSSQVQGTVLEPCKVGVRLDLGGEAGDIHLTLSDMRMNLSPDVLELALSLQSSVLEPLVQPPPDRCDRLPHHRRLCLPTTSHAVYRMRYMDPCAGVATHAASSAGYQSCRPTI